jgi:ribosomal protein L7/L12
MKKLDPKQHKATLMQLIAKKRTIEAIKYIRTHTGLGLKESKNLYDRILADNNFADEYLFDNSEGYSEITGKKPYSETQLEALETELASLLKSGKKFEAIKYLKEKMNIGLKETKTLIDELEIRQNFDSNNTDENLSSGESNTETDDPTVPKYKSSMQTGDKFEDIVFEKSIKRDAIRRKQRSNSGCMLTLMLLVGSGVLFGMLIRIL